jgi:purine-nucleoside phosphorylase
MRSVAIGDTGKRALVFGTRTHFYEGHGRAGGRPRGAHRKAAGCSTIVLTNGCGGLARAWAPGTPVLIRDHINLTATSPIEGANFVDLTDLYSARLRAIAMGSTRPRRGRLRAVPGAALRDPGRGADGQDPRR